MNRRFTFALALGAGLAATAGRLSAQDLRFRTTTTGQYVQLRPLVQDTVGNYVSAPLQYAAPITEDLEISAWGLGVQGLRGYALLRGRAAAGSELVWPRYDDHFDALYAYLELERPTWRLRGGRQQRFSGLGFYAFDGLTATYRPLATIRIEGYGGRGLARGFLEPISSPQIRALDPLRPEQGTILLGGSVWAAPWQDAAITAVYQRELLSDRSGLNSERAAFDAQLGLSEKLYLTGAADIDIAAGEWGKARLAAQYRLPSRGFLEVEAFRYRPVFDLTTIWGVFSPEAHTGGAATLSLSPTDHLSVSAGVEFRHYSPSAKTDPFLIGGSDSTGIHDNVTELNGGARWRAGNLQLDGTYRFSAGYGGRQSGGDAGVAYAPQGGFRIGLNGTAFQQVEDFRVANGTVYGAGIELRTPLWSRASLRLELNRYWHRRENGTAAIDWNQTRGLVGFDWTFGANADRTSGGAR